MKTVVRLALFHLDEYVRVGRLLVEAVVFAAVILIFFRPQQDLLGPAGFYSVIGVVMPLLALYSSSVFSMMAERQAGMLWLSHGVARSHYLFSHLLAGWLLTLAVYLLFCGYAALLNPVIGLNLGGWAAASLPLLLNQALVVTAAFLLSPLVLSARRRLLVLALLTAAFSGSIIGGPIREVLDPTLLRLLQAVQTLLGAPLVPAFVGYRLSLQAELSGMTAWMSMLSQVSLTLSLLGLMHLLYARRDLVQRPTA
jgi:ABC-type transport system involved in multi-copper enzyme maturation permease subunit